jgi:hypothetical protein
MSESVEKLALLPLKSFIPAGNHFWVLVLHLLYEVDLFEATAFEHRVTETERTRHLARLRSLAKRALFCRVYGSRLLFRASGFGFTPEEAADADARVDVFMQKYDVKVVTDPDDPNTTVGWVVTSRLPTVPSQEPAHVESLQQP